MLTLQQNNKLKIELKESLVCLIGIVKFFLT